jgi:hypothetical protein
MPRYDNFGGLDTPYADEVDTFFLKMNARLRPDQLKPGELAMSINGRMDVDGAWQPRKGVSAFGPLLSASSAALTIPFYLYANKVISSADRVTTLVTITTSTAHGFITGTQVAILDISGTVDPTGNRTITSTGANTFTFTIPGATGSETYTLGGTPIAGAPIISDAVNAAYGSCKFSDPSDNNDEYIILALYDKAQAVSLIDESVTDIEYPAGVTITQPVEMLQAFDKVFIFRDGATALSWDGDLTPSPAFAKVANGAYTQPKVFTAATNTAASQGVVTVTETSHGLSVGDKVKIFDNGSTTLSETEEYTVATVPTSGTFTFFADVDDFAATAVVLGIRQSNGRGFTHMPAPAWASYHQRRLIVPFAYTTTGSSGSEVITARNVTDEILFSDILDSDTYDQLQNQFRLTAGIADYVQTVHPFTDDAAIGFNRNSLHLITGLSGSLTDIAIKEITKEAGLVARKSVVTIGNSIYFLSDNGVYAADFGDLYNLRGAGLPLSDPINPIIRRINGPYASRAVGIFHDNRYYLAIPLDDSPVNNAVIVYNVLNQGWESLDTISQLGWDVANFMVASPNGINQLFAVNSFGGIHIIDDRLDDRDNIYTYPGVDAASYFIEAEATTRQMTFSTPERKKYNTFEVQVESTDTNTSDAEINGIFENLDTEVPIASISGIMGTVLPISEDVSLRGRIGNIRSYGMQVQFVPTAGRPKLRLIKLTAAPTFRALTQAS